MEFAWLIVSSQWVTEVHSISTWPGIGKLNAWWWVVTTDIGVAGLEKWPSGTSISGLAAGWVRLWLQLVWHSCRLVQEAAFFTSSASMRLLMISRATKNGHKTYDRHQCRYLAEPPWHFDLGFQALERRSHGGMTWDDVGSKCQVDAWYRRCSLSQFVEEWSLGELEIGNGNCDGCEWKQRTNIELIPPCTPAFLATIVFKLSPLQRHFVDTMDNLVYAAHNINLLCEISGIQVSYLYHHLVLSRISPWAWIQTHLWT